MDIKFICKWFSIGFSDKIFRLGRGFENKVYLLKTKNQYFVIKIYDLSKVSEEYLNLKQKITTKLIKEGISIPKEIKNKRGGFFLRNKHSYIEVQKYVFGKSPKNISKKIAHDLGFIHGKIDKVLFKRRFSQNELNSMNNTHLLLAQNNFIPAKLFQDYLNIQKELEFKKEIRVGVINGDFNAWNTLINKKKIVAILDWSDLHKDYLILDPAIFITGNLISESKIQLNKIKEYLRGYQKSICLNKDEKESFKLILEYAQLRNVFWLASVLEGRKSRTMDLKSKLKTAIQKYQILKKLNDNRLRNYA